MIMGDIYNVKNIFPNTELDNYYKSNLNIIN